MPGKTRRGELLLTAADRQMLEEMARSRTAAVREAERAKILLAYVEHRSIADVMRRVGVGGSTVYKCIDKALADGVVAGLKDAYHRPHAPEITECPWRPKTAEIWRRQKSGTKIAGLEPGQGRATARRSEPLTRRRDGYAGAWL